MHPLVEARKLRRVASLFVKQRSCPICGWAGYRFEPFGNPMVRRADARCPICGSLERHRAAFLLLRDQISKGQQTLHVAPEPMLVAWLVSLSSEYLNVDLYRPAMRQMDLTSIDLPPSCKTLVWCSHVLEHIYDDRQVLREIYRVLKPVDCSSCRFQCEVNAPTKIRLFERTPSASNDSFRKTT